MATKTAMEKGEQRSSKRQEPGAIQNCRAAQWASGTSLTRFLSDVRAEMRKVVAPTRKEVEATTAVVIVTVFLFGFFFFIVDYIFNKGLHAIITRLGGAQ